MEVTIQTKEQIKKNVKVLLLFKGLAAIIIGALLLFRPKTSLALVMLYIGVFWFFDGISKAHSSLKGRRQDKAWIWGFLFSVLSVVAAIIVFKQPDLAALISSKVLVTTLGVFVLIVGIMSVVLGINIRRERGDNSFILIGVLVSLLGILLIAHPVKAVYALLIVIGILMIISGVVLIKTAIDIKSNKVTEID